MLARGGLARARAAPPPTPQTVTPAVPLLRFADPATPAPPGGAACVHVLFPRPDARNTALVQALLAAADKPRGDGSTLFCLPMQQARIAQRVAEGRQPPEAARASAVPWRDTARLLAQASLYDYPRAMRTLRGLCAGAAPDRPALCEQVLQGPYLLAMSAPLADGAGPGEFVLFDLGRVDPARFATWIAALSAPGLPPTAPGTERLAALRAAAEPLLAAAGEAAVFASLAPAP